RMSRRWLSRWCQKSKLVFTVGRSRMPHIPKEVRSKVLSVSVATCRVRMQTGEEIFFIDARKAEDQKSITDRPGYLADLLAKAKTGRVLVTLPKFKFTSTFRLDDQLK